jgi:hypothetical protein
MLAIKRILSMAWLSANPLCQNQVWFCSRSIQPYLRIVLNLEFTYSDWLMDVSPDGSPK